MSVIENDNNFSLVELGNDSKLCKVFQVMGYSKGNGLFEDGNVDDLSHQMMNELLRETNVATSGDIFRGLILNQPSMASFGKKRYAKDRGWRTILSDFLAICIYWTSEDGSIPSVNRITKKAVTRAFAQQNHNFHKEDSTASIKGGDLPNYPTQPDNLSWFTWADSVKHQLMIWGLYEVIKDATFAAEHPRKNAAVDGLLCKTLSQAKSCLAIVSDSGLQGDGHGRWQKLVSIHEHESLIKIILKDLTSQFQKLKVQKVSEFETYAGNFLRLKDRLEYMVTKAKEAKITSLDEYPASGWKDKFLDKIQCTELSPICLRVKENLDLDLHNSHLTINSHILEKDLIKLSKVQNPNADKGRRESGRNKKNDDKEEDILEDSKPQTNSTAKFGNKTWQILCNRHKSEKDEAKKALYEELIEEVKPSKGNNKSDDKNSNSKNGNFRRKKKRRRESQPEEAKPEKVKPSKVKAREEGVPRKLKRRRKNKRGETLASQGDYEKAKFS